MLFFDNIVDVDAILENFTEEQLAALRESCGKSKEGTKRQLRVWVHRGLITLNAETGIYSKTEYYLNRTR